MDFRTVLSLIIKGFNEEQIRYAVIGGFALGALGVPRATIDLDFLVHRGDLSKIDRIMKENNYEPESCAKRRKILDFCIGKIKNLTSEMNLTKSDVHFLGISTIFSD